MANSQRNKGRMAALRFRCFGIPVEVQATFFVIVGLLGFAGSVPNLLIWLGIAFGSILAHELGHALTARSFGSPTSIVLYGFGGLTTHQRMSVKRGLLVTLAGPFTGLAIGLVLVVVAQVVGATHGYARIALIYALWINIAWSLINLLPVLPLDGGNAMRAVVHLVTGADRELLVRRVSIGVAVAGALIAVRFGLLFTAFFALFFIGDNWKAMQSVTTSAHADELRDAALLLEAGDAHGAIALLDKVLNERPDAQLMVLSKELKAWALLSAHDTAGAQATIATLPADVTASFHLQAAILLEQGDIDRGLAFAVEGFRRGAIGGRELAPHVSNAGQVGALTERLLHIEPEVGVPAAFHLQVWLHQAERYADALAVAVRLRDAGHVDQALVAYNAACSAARLGRIDEACDWIERALDDGFGDTQLVDHDEDLAPLRVLPRFEQLRARLPGSRS